MRIAPWSISIVSIPATMLAAALAVAQDNSAKDQPRRGENKPEHTLSLENEEAAIRANAREYVEAYNRRDSKTMASM